CHPDAIEYAASDDEGKAAERDENRAHPEGNQDGTEHSADTMPVDERAERQEADDVGGLNDHQEPGDPVAIETELPVAAERDPELLERRVGHCADDAGGAGQNDAGGHRGRFMAA